MTTESESAAGERECDDSPHGAKDCGHPENHWPTPAEPSAANETDVSGDMPYAEVYDRLMAAEERVRVVEGERDELRAGVENLIRAAEFSANSSLSRDFNGRPGPADVSASSLRALLDGTR